MKMIKVRGNFLLGGLLSISMSSPAYAYLDPGTGSIVLQAIIGGIAATLFITRGYYYKVKAWLGIGKRAIRSDKAADE
jgi:hypothetical protein